MMDNVFVAGLGVNCAIGNNVDECLAAFNKSEHGIALPKFLRTAHGNEIPVAEVKLSNSELAGITGFPAGTSRTAMLSMKAAQEALQDAAIPDIGSYKTGFISANTVGGMDKTEQFFEDFLQDQQSGDLQQVINHECGSITELVAARLGLQHQVTTISTACSSSASAIMYAARLIRNGLLDIAVAGGCDALTRFTLNGFNTLMILDRQLCQPFDNNRRGLNLGEGAGYLVLVSSAVARTLNRTMRVKLSGYCNANDAYHQTASSPNGTGSFLSMQGALAKAGLQPGDISYINLHGTGTQNNDLSESIAIRRLFGECSPPLSSTKTFTGHTLGGCGGIEAVFSSLSIQHGLIYPNLRFETPIEETKLYPEIDFLQNQDIKHVLSNSFGFGGNCTSLTFSKV